MHILGYFKDFLTISAAFSVDISQKPFSRVKPPTCSGSNSTSVVIWHGMGDTYNSTGMQAVKTILEEEIPNVFIHSVYLDLDETKDQRLSILGDLNTQIRDVCDQLDSIPELKNGFNAVGFSQGGLFLRSAMELCGLPIKTLVTYGSPHNGVTDLPPCSEGNWLCERRNSILRRQIYNENVQNSVVQAQYFRDVYNFEKYLENSAFLKFVNNEFVKDIQYVRNLTKLEKLVMVMFTKDDMLLFSGRPHWH
ncbi:hypothetical protein KL942_000501 [Ogataea angusta]|uniref:Palmitoyl-protein thioesterase 1 n=1 Tax=Pichia angusta TaxID=870730 RepID=A0ABQ7S370_PICAN|nr:hypothetical protein KL942_000501 [Ogataea angusta]KAG7852442.1 hypothetical protein KL940_000143 [Ogataea angusta]